MGSCTGGILTVLEELQVGKVIIGEQGETSEQYIEFSEIAKKKKIPVAVVKKVIL